MFQLWSTCVPTLLLAALPCSKTCPGPACSPLGQHLRLGGTQSPCTAPNLTTGTVPAGSGFHGFPNPLLPLQHSLPVYCSGLSRKEKLEERRGSQPGHAPENCILRINSYQQQHPPGPSKRDWEVLCPCHGAVAPLAAKGQGQSWWLLPAQPDSGDIAAFKGGLLRLDVVN